MMNRVAMIGHHPEYIDKPEETKRLISRTIDLISYQYEQNLVFNIPADTGVALWSAEECLNMKTKYHLFLTCSPNILSQAWYEEQRLMLNRCFGLAWATTIYDPQNFSYDTEQKMYYGVVDASNFVIAYWNGKRQGRTFETIRYALKQNKIVLGMKNLQMITNKDLEYGTNL